MKTASLLCLVLPALISAGCFNIGAPDDESTDTWDDLPDYEKDLAEYKALSSELDENREEFLGEVAGEHRAFGPRLLWLQFAQWDPTLHGYDTASGERIDYAFSVGGGDAWNFEASDEVVATSYRDGDKVVIEAYDADASDVLLDSLELPAPMDEQRWWAYAVEGSDVYYVTTGSDTRLFRWKPGSSPAHVATLEETGAEVGIFFAFGVEAGRMMFLESGRVWVLDLGSMQSTFVGHETEVTGPISFDKTGAFVPTYDEPLYYDFATGELSNVADRVMDSGFGINETYNDVHRYEADGVLEDGRLHYIGATGLFQLDLGTGAVKPVLLEPFDSEVRIEYRYPAVTSDGATYVLGLTSESGSVGADGPIFVVR